MECQFFCILQLVYIVVLCWHALFSCVIDRFSCLLPSLQVSSFSDLITLQFSLYSFPAGDPVPTNHFLLFLIQHLWPNVSMFLFVVNAQTLKRLLVRSGTYSTLLIQPIILLFWWRKEMNLTSPVPRVLTVRLLPSPTNSSLLNSLYWRSKPLW